MASRNPLNLVPNPAQPWARSVEKRFLEIDSKLGIAHTNSVAAVAQSTSAFATVAAIVSNAAASASGSGDGIDNPATPTLTPPAPDDITVTTNLYVSATGTVRAQAQVNVATTDGAVAGYRVWTRHYSPEYDTSNSPTNYVAAPSPNPVDWSVSDATIATLATVEDTAATPPYPATITRTTGDAFTVSTPLGLLVGGQQYDAWLGVNIPTSDGSVYNLKVQDASGATLGQASCQATGGWVKAGPATFTAPANTTYAWSGSADDSTSTMTQNGATRTNLVTDPRAALQQGLWGTIPEGGDDIVPTLNQGAGDSGLDLADSFVTTTITDIATGLPRIGVMGVAVAAGTTYTASLYGRSSKADVTFVTLIWHDSSGNPIGDPIEGEVDDQDMGEWSQRSVTATAPAGATSCDILYSWLTAPNIGGTYDATAALLEVGEDLQPYFDGSFASGSSIGAQLVLSASSGGAPGAAIQIRDAWAVDHGASVPPATVDPGEPYVQAPQSSVLPVTVYDLDTGADYQVKAETISVDGTASGMSDVKEFTTPNTMLTVPTPSTPVLSSSLGTVSAKWDGFDGTGAVMPLNFRSVRAQVSSAQSGPWDFAGLELRAAGTTVITGQAVGSTVWVQFVTEGTQGNFSNPSPAVSIVVRGVADTDIDQSLATMIASAGGGSTIYRSTATPDPSKGKDGDTWEQWSTLGAGGKLLAFWRNSSGTWVQGALDPTYLPQVDIGQGTFGSLDGSRLAAHSVTADAMAANSIEAGALAAGAVTAGTVAAGVIDATQLASGAVTTDKLAAGAVTATSLAADAITGKTITGGTVNGATVNGGVVNGATVQTSTSGNRAVLASDSLTLYGGGGQAAVVQGSSDGSSAYLSMLGTGGAVYIGAGKGHTFTPAGGNPGVTVSGLIWASGGILGADGLRIDKNGTLQIQHGSINLSGLSSTGTTFTLTFPEPFFDVPDVYLTAVGASPQNYGVAVGTTTSSDAHIVLSNSASSTLTVRWLAVI